MLATGLQRLDGFLQGGIPGGVVTDVFGAGGTGKTQLLFQLALNSSESGGSVLYIDATGRFRPERIAGMREDGSGADALDRIAVMRVTNTAEQVDSLRAMNRASHALVLVDDVTDLFSYEYGEDVHVLEKYLSFMRYMRGLALHALTRKIPVIVTNTVRQIDGRQTENMHAAIDPYTHIKISLRADGNKLRGSASWMQNKQDFAYEIGGRGLRDI